MRTLDCGHGIPEALLCGACQAEDKVGDLRRYISPHMAIPTMGPIDDLRTLVSLGLDGLDCAVIAIEIEDDFGVQFSDLEIETWRSVADIRASLRKQLGLVQ